MKWKIVKCEWNAKRAPVKSQTLHSLVFQKGSDAALYLNLSSKFGLKWSTSALKYRTCIDVPHCLCVDFHKCLRHWVSHSHTAQHHQQFLWKRCVWIVWKHNRQPGCLLEKYKYNDKMSRNVFSDVYKVNNLINFCSFAEIEGITFTGCKNRALLGFDKLTVINCHFFNCTLNLTSCGSLTPHR